MQFIISLQINFMIFLMLMTLCHNGINAQLNEAEMITELDKYDSEAKIFCNTQVHANWAVAT